MHWQSDGHQCTPVGNTVVTKGGPSHRVWVSRRCVFTYGHYRLDVCVDAISEARGINVHTYSGYQRRTDGPSALCVHVWSFTPYVWTLDCMYPHKNMSFHYI